MDTYEKKPSGENNLKNEKRSKSSSDTPPMQTFGNKGEDLSSKFELPSLKIDKQFLDEHDKRELEVEEERKVSYAHYNKNAPRNISGLTFDYSAALETKFDGVDSEMARSKNDMPAVEEVSDIASPYLGKKIQKETERLSSV